MLHPDQALYDYLDEKHFSARHNIQQHQPVFYRLQQEEDRKALQQLLQNHSSTEVSDTIHSQLRELIKTSHPARVFTPEALEDAIAQHLDGRSMKEYGVWVYYPWNHKLVHILDEAEFTYLRTNRNNYKITDKERQILATKKLGVIGLSVGQSVSLALAMERSFGELRIADFDTLDLSNLNRLRSGVHNIGLSKTVIVAREIAEIDPFLRITCYHEGINADNLDSFILDGGKLDVLIDECDSVDIKVLCRIVAKKHGVPVLMEASDRATIDVERFDLEPDRSILHGYIDHLDIARLPHLKTSEEKLPYMLPIAGVETLSARMKASALEVGQSIATWPQLASAVALGGGITADICRRILLDQYHESGRYFIDVEELVGDKKSPGTDFSVHTPALTRADMQAAAAALQLPSLTVIPPAAEQLQLLIAAAAAAPSAGNNQPWKFFFDGKDLWLFHERSRSESYGDFRQMASQMALGACIENLSLQAKEQGINIDIQLLEDAPGKPLARICFPAAAAAAARDPLVSFISARHTNRLKADGRPIAPAVLAGLQDAIAGIEGIQLHYREGGDLEALANIIGTAERLRVFIPEGHHDLFEKELRWTAEEAMNKKDGLDLRTFQVSILEQFGMRLARDPRVAALLHEWDAGKGLERITRNAVRSSAAIGLITAPQLSLHNNILAGRALERIWLRATEQGLAFQPVMAPVLHFARLRHNAAGDMPADVKLNFYELYKEFLRIFDLQPTADEPLFLFRIGHAGTPAVQSIRLDLDDIFYT